MNGSECEIQSALCLGKSISKVYDILQFNLKTLRKTAALFFTHENILINKLTCQMKKILLLRGNDLLDH